MSLMYVDGYLHKNLSSIHIPKDTHRTPSFTKTLTSKTKQSM